MTTGIRRKIIFCSIVALGIVYILPVIMILAGSLNADDNAVLSSVVGVLLPSELSLQNYFEVFARVDFMRFFLNSALINITIVLLGLIINSMAAFALARLRWVGRETILKLTILLMMVPLEAIAVPLFYQLSLLGWRDTYIIQILPFCANAFSIYLFYIYFLSIPKELDEAAYLDGASVLQLYWHVIFPNAKPVFASVAILTFLTQWGSYLWPLMVTSTEKVRPLPLAISNFYSLPPLQWGDIFAFGIMMVLPVIIVFVIFQNLFERSVMTVGIKG